MKRQPRPIPYIKQGNEVTVSTGHVTVKRTLVDIDHEYPGWICLLDEHGDSKYVQVSHIGTIWEA
jgi:hypothetical protein